MPNLRQNMARETHMPSDAEVEAAAKALWLDASKERFGEWPINEPWQSIWRRSARAALLAAEQARETAPPPEISSS